MSLFITFAKPRGDAFTVGPHPEFRFHGDRLMLSPDGPVVAEHENHTWQTKKGDYSRLECEGRVDIQFARAKETSRVFGPYSMFSCVDGISYVENRIFAFCDESNRDWYSYELGDHWKVMVVRESSRLGS